MQLSAESSERVVFIFFNSEKINGRDIAARPIITPETPV
jgi:hypothetical protein